MKPRPKLRKSAISPASRARCLKPAPHDPRWTYRFRLLRSREETYPPLRGQIDASRYGPAGIERHWSPVARGSADRDRAASAAPAKGVRVAPQPGHRPRSAPPNASGGAPRGSRRAHYQAEKASGDYFFSGSYPREARVRGGHASPPLSRRQALPALHAGCL